MTQIKKESPQHESNQQLREEIEYLCQRLLELESSLDESRTTLATLQKSEQLYRTILENIPPVTYVIDVGNEPLNRTIYVSPQAEKVTGFSSAEFFNDPLLWVKLLHPEDQARVMAESERADLTGDAYVAEYRVINDENRILWFHDESVLVKDEHGQPLYRVGVWTDITKHKLAELAQQQSEDLYRRAIAAAGAVPYVINHADRWNYAFVGEGIFSMTGYAAAEITSAIWDSIRIEAVPRGRLAHLTFEEADRLTNENISILWECDFLIRTRDGQTRWVADTSIKNLDDKSGKLLSIGIYQDITERKRIETELRASKQRLEILHNIDRALLSARSSEEITSSTLVRIRQLIPSLRASVALFDPGSPNAHFFAIDDNWGSLFSDESIMVEDHIVATLKQGLPWKTDDRLSDTQVSNYDERLANEAGIRTWLSLPLLYQGQLIGSLNLGRGLGQPFTQPEAEIAQGIANQLAIAIQQAQLNKELQNQLAERERLIGELGTINAELERFNYTVSHELKSPVVTIKGFLGSIATDLQNEKYERAQKDILRVSSATDKLHDTLSNLLELARIGYTTNPPEEIDLVQLAHAALETVHNRIQTGNITVHISPDLPKVYGDHILLREVFENLIDNAAKYSDDQLNLAIEIGTRQKKNEPIIFVKDNGMGIDPRYHDRVFHLFEKLNPTSEGTGVGLALVKRIIETHGGKIWVESEGLGKGSTFCFTIPDRRNPNGFN